MTIGGNLTAHTDDLSIPGAGASATASWDDFIFTGPPGDITVHGMNLFLNGSLTTTATQSNNWAAFDRATASISVHWNVGTGISFFSFASYTQNKYGFTGELSATWTDTFDPIVTVGSLHGNFTTPDFTISTGVPVPVSLELATNAYGFYRYNAETDNNPKSIDLSSVSDFSHTLTFATDGPVFNLPPGYSVFSVEAGIVDNHFVVLEPSGCVLVGLGFIALIGDRKRRRSSAKPSNTLCS